MVVELIDYLRVLQRRWVVVALATLFGLAAGFLTASDENTPVDYTATQTLSVVQPSVSATAPLVFFSPSQLAVYTTVGEVPRRVAEELDYAGTPQQLASTIITEPDDAVGVLRITATDVDPTRAALVANTFGRKLRAVIAGDARDELQTQIDAGERDVDRLERRANDLDAEIALAPPDIGVLTARRDALINQYRIAYDQLQALRARTTSSEPVVTLEAAVPERAATGLAAPKSRPARMAIFGLLGLLLGAALALVLDRVDTRIRTKQDVEAVTGLPVLAQIPFLPRRHRHELITATRPASPFAEAYRNLRSTLAFARGPLPASANGDGDPHATPAGRAIDQEPTVICVTSSGPYEGKTTTVANLAASYAETGLSVLVLDCDFRRPRLHQVFGTRETPGLADTLDDPRQFRSDNEVICATSVDGVRLVPAGTPTSNPARLFGRARALIEASRRNADIVLVDTPPYLVANDAAELIPWVDAVVLVIKSRRSNRETTERMIEGLNRQQAPAVGVVLIGSDQAQAGYSPYYYHRANARNDKARHRWRRLLRLGPPKEKAPTERGPDEPEQAGGSPTAERTDTDAVPPSDAPADTDALPDDGHAGHTDAATHPDAPDDTDTLPDDRRIEDTVTGLVTTNDAANATNGANGANSSNGSAGGPRETEEPSPTTTP